MLSLPLCCLVISLCRLQLNTPPPTTALQLPTTATTADYCLPLLLLLLLLLLQLLLPLLLPLLLQLQDAEGNIKKPHKILGPEKGGHNWSVSCLQFEGTCLVTGSYDKTVKVWNLVRSSEK